MRASIKPKGNANTRRGFTIVELLIVIVVIGILAAITIVAFNGVQDKAKKSAAQSAVTQANKKVLAYAAQNSDMYPPDLGAADVTNTTGLQYSYNNTSSPKTYGITATNGNYSYFVSNVTTQPMTGGYMGHSAGGVTAITNLIPNPSFEGNSTTFWDGSFQAGQGTGTTSSVAVAGAPSGLRVATMNFTAVSGTSAEAGFYSSAVTVNVGDTITASGYVKVNKAQLFVARIRWNGLADVSSTPTIIPANTWTRLSFTATAPTGATSTSIRFYSVAGTGFSAWAVNDSIQLDGVMVVKSDIIHNYADGNSNNWVWNGAINNSTSTGIPQ